MAAQPIVPFKTYVLVFVALIVLVAITTGAAFIDLGPFNTVVALGIAFLKMMLVLLFFMHLLHSHKLTQVTVVAAAFWLMLLMGLVFADYHSRNWIPDPAPWSSSAPPTHP
jgi:cytochrome c oxidase subunit IV